MKYTIELICGKGNTFRVYEGTETGARKFARNLIIKKGKDRWIATIYAHPDTSTMKEVGRIWYENEHDMPELVGKWVYKSYFKSKTGTMNADGTVKYLW